MEDLSRGIQRIPIQCGEFLPLFVYYGIYRYTTSKKKKYMLLIAFCSIMIILSVVRQTIVFTAIFGLWYCIKGASIYKKFSICGIATIFILVIIPRIPFYNDIMELTEKQMEDSNENEEDIRIQAWRYYTYESWDNPVTTLFGNGIPSIGNSKYGNTFEANANATKCFAEDVGYAGFSYYFGVVTTLILLIFLIRSCLHHTPPEKQFLSIYLVQITISSIISAPILYYQSIIGIATILYMIYYNDDTDQLSDGGQYNHLRNLSVHHSTPLRSLSAKTVGR
ncbi:MAG: hypothetical protein K2M76_07750 [Muribaculaceae bacterium]|nr:hypothetical protein [Muribaculaceae bacterium]